MISRSVHGIRSLIFLSVFTQYLPSSTFSTERHATPRHPQLRTPRHLPWPPLSIADKFFHHMLVIYLSAWFADKSGERGIASSEVRACISIFVFGNFTFDLVFLFWFCFCFCFCQFLQSLASLSLLSALLLSTQNIHCSCFSFKFLILSNKEYVVSIYYC